MTAREQIAAIEPGSTEYGERQNLEAGLGQLASMGGSSAAPGRGPAPPPPVDSVDDPLAALLSGALNPGASDNLTDGLSVGPGPGPAAPAPQDPYKVRLQQVATQAKSPLVRAMARNELRRLVGEKL